MNIEVFTCKRHHDLSYRGGGTGPADLAAAGRIIYSEVTTKDDLTT